MSTLNLTDTQKAQIQSIRQQSRQQIQAIVQPGQS
jgi:Spy/CpxP family protein refolding chaperone